MMPKCKSWANRAAANGRAIAATHEPRRLSVERWTLSVERFERSTLNVQGPTSNVLSRLMSQVRMPDQAEVFHEPFR
jgi:hypothetical protein